MEKEEKIQKIISKVVHCLESLKGKYDCITGVEIPVDIKQYFPDKDNLYGSFIHELYAEHVILITLRTPRYGLVDTPVNLNEIKYSQLSDEDLEKLFKEWGK